MLCSEILFEIGQFNECCQRQNMKITTKHYETMNSSMYYNSLKLTISVQSRVTTRTFEMRTMGAFVNRDEVASLTDLGVKTIKVIETSKQSLTSEAISDKKATM